MITSIYQQGNQLYSLSNTNQLSLHDVSDFITLPHTEMPKIESPLGISLREPISSYELQQLTSESKFVSYESQEDSISDILLIYDKRTVIALDLIKLVSKTLSVSVLFGGLNGINLLEYGEEIVSVYCCQEKGQSSEQLVENRLIITTTHGRILSFTMLQKSEQQEKLQNTNLQLKLQHETSIHLLTKQLNKESSTMEDEKDNNNNNNLLNMSMTMYGQQEHNIEGGSKSFSKEYVTAIGFNRNEIYCATTLGRLIEVEKAALSPVVEYETNEVNNELFSNGNINSINNISINNVNSINKHQPIANSESPLHHPIKIIFERNSLLLLYPKHLLEFNTHTHTLTNSINLPFTTLDITAQHHPKTQATNLIMTGECNVFYTMAYPWTNSKEKHSLFKRVNISSKLSKSILQTNNNYLFVGGSDGTIDVYKNANMHLMVLLLKSE